ncbi:MAG: YebC/PmpR family DNA-binding transcriptional regulator [Bacilli bacterium]
MGRAYEVRKASIQKTGAARGKIYSMYAKEIYQAAKNGGIEIESNASLKRLIERAKKEQVPADIIKRAIDKVSNGVDENYTLANYEIFGPASSTVIVECLTDNLNRSVSSLRAVINKCHIKMGAMGSVSYMYDNLCVVGFKGLTEEETIDALINNDVDIVDIEKEENEIIIYGDVSNLFKIKEAILNVLPKVEFDIDEIAMLPKEKIILALEDLELFKKMLVMFDDIEDVSNIYHNVENV